MAKRSSEQDGQEAVADDARVAVTVDADAVPVKRRKRGEGPDCHGLV